LHRAFADGGESGAKAKDALHGTWVGHPLHVILTDIPLGAWTTGMVFDAVAAVAGSEPMDASADACIGLGLAGAIGAAVTGLTRPLARLTLGTECGFCLENFNAGVDVHGGLGSSRRFGFADTADYVAPVLSW
jgi:uncharacterized membrane protein